VNKKKPIIEISETTEEQIKQTKELVKSKHGINVPKPDLLKLIKLIKELQWWFKVTPKNSAHHIDEKMAINLQKSFKKNYKKDISMSEAYDAARGLMVLVPYKEKQRLADEMRFILVKHKKIVYTPELLEKTDKLFQFHYGLKLSKEQLKWIVRIVSKTVWYEEEVDGSVAKCLDDLLVYADKRKRGKRVNCLDLHDKVRQSLDWAVNELKLKKKDFDPLYRDEIGIEVTVKDGKLVVGEKAKKPEVKS